MNSGFSRIHIKTLQYRFHRHCTVSCWCMWETELYRPSFTSNCLYYLFLPVITEQVLGLMKDHWVVLVKEKKKKKAWRWFIVIKKEIWWNISCCKSVSLVFISVKYYSLQLFVLWEDCCTYFLTEVRLLFYLVWSSTMGEKSSPWLSFQA